MPCKIKAKRVPSPTRPRAPRKPAMSEDSLQRAVAQFLALALPYDAVWWHTPNEGKRGWQAQRAFRGGGGKAGVPDILIVWRGRAYFIELKVGRNALTDVQRAFHRDLTDAGCPVAVARSLEAVAELCVGWGIPLRGTLSSI